MAKHRTSRAYASPQLAKARNTHVTATNFDEQTQYPEIDIATPEGVLVRICHVPIEEGGTQLSVFINTEDWEMPEINGNPPMQVLLNDATLYDQEPNHD